MSIELPAEYEWLMGIVDKLEQKQRYVFIKTFIYNVKTQTQARNLKVSSPRICELRKLSLQNLDRMLKEEGLCIPNWEKN